MQNQAMVETTVWNMKTLAKKIMHKQLLPFFPFPGSKSPSPHICSWLMSLRQSHHHSKSQIPKICHNRNFFDALSNNAFFPFPG